MGAFTLQLEEFAKKAGANAELVVRRVGIDVFSSVIRKTPVDTGRARANWTAKVGSPSGVISDAIDKGKYGSDPSGASVSKANAALAGFEIGQAIFITNNLPYAQRLENGYSTQAPSGMVRLTVVEFNDFVRNAVARLP